MPWNEIARDVDPKVRQSVTAVVAYIGSDAPNILALRRGDKLVCDASDTAIRGGMTSADALRTYLNRGVELYSVSGLHAKVVIGSRWVWIGSANASTSSENLLEASVRVTDVETRRDVRSWAVDLMTEDAAVSRLDLGRLLDLPVKRRAGLPTRRMLPIVLPDDPRPLFVVDLVPGASEASHRAAVKQQSQIRRVKRQRGVRGALNWFEWPDSECPYSPGAWIVPITSGHPGRPCQVVHVSHVRKGRFIVWTASVPTARRPKKAELMEACGLGPNRPLVDYFVPKGPIKRRSIADLYR